MKALFFKIQVIIMSREIPYNKYRDEDKECCRTKGNEAELLLRFLAGESITRDEFDRVVDFLLINDVDKKLDMDPKYIMK
jgi:hypothetical protein